MIAAAKVFSLKTKKIKKIQSYKNISRNNNVEWDIHHSKR